MSEQTTAAPPTTYETVTASIEFRFWDTKVSARIPVPAGKVQPTELLSACQAIAGAVSNVAVSAVNERGLSVSCKKGCGACCRQLVPLTEPEARNLYALVENMPEPRRSEVKCSFREATERLDEAGLLQPLADRDLFPYAEVRRFGADYFRLGIPCPFLEEESCSIHAERPVICREYLVTSAPEHCAEVFSENVSVIPVPVKVSTAMARMDMRPGDRNVRWVPLVLALDWAEQNPPNPPDRTGPQLLEALFAQLSEKGTSHAEQAAPGATMAVESLVSDD